MNKTVGRLFFMVLIFTASENYCHADSGASRKVSDTVVTPVYTEAAMRKDFSPDIVLLMHEYIYTVSVEIYGYTTSMAMVKNETGNFDAWVPDSNINRLYATALLADTQGHCITSRYAIAPWENKYDQLVLKKIFSKALDISEDFVTVGGISRGIQVTKIIAGKKNEFIAESDSSVMAYTGDDSAHIMVLKLKNKDLNTPGVTWKVHGVKRPADPGNEKNIGAGYILRCDGAAGSVEQSFGTKLEKIKLAINAEGQFVFDTQQDWLSEGAPIFDMKGNLISVYSYAH